MSVDMATLCLVVKDERNTIEVEIATIKRADCMKNNNDYPSQNGFLFAQNDFHTYHRHHPRRNRYIVG